MLSLFMNNFSSQSFESESSCVPTWATAWFLPASWALLPPKAEMMGSYVISPPCLLQVSTLDRKSEDLSPLLVATLGLSYQRSAAVSPENSCHTPVASIISILVSVTCSDECLREERDI